MANVIATTAVGKRFRPHFVKQIESPEGELVQNIDAELMATLPVKQSTMNVIRGGLRDVVNAGHGTGKKAKLPTIEVAGKTGTSQVVKMGRERLKPSQMPWNHRDHAWFVAYAPLENPEIAIAAIVEHAEGGGGAIAAPLVREVLHKFFELKRQRENTKYAENRSSASGAF
jgi:penicillin-binding protein 2